MWWLFVINSVVEVSAALVALVSPNSMPPFSKIVGEQGKDAVRWWAAAVLGLGIATFLVRNAPDSDVGKQALGLAMLLYHIFLSCFCAKVYPKATSVGAVVHVPLAVAFAWWLKSTGFF